MFIYDVKYLVYINLKYNIKKLWLYLYYFIIELVYCYEVKFNKILINF